MTRQNAGGRGTWQRALVQLTALVAIIVAIDQLTKALITKSLTLGQSVPIISDVMHFTLVRNTGMAFGLLSRADVPYKAALVTLLSVVAMGAVTYYAIRAPNSDMWTRFGLTCILGGAVGNVIDRVRLGYVVDFVDVFYRDVHWPAFNVADTCICIGVGLLILDSLLARAPESNRVGDTEAVATPGRGET